MPKVLLSDMRCPKGDLPFAGGPVGRTNGTTLPPPHLRCALPHPREDRQTVRTGRWQRRAVVVTQVWEAAWVGANFIQNRTGNQNLTDGHTVSDDFRQQKRPARAAPTRPHGDDGGGLLQA